VLKYGVKLNHKDLKYTGFYLSTYRASVRSGNHVRAI